MHIYSKSNVVPDERDSAQYDADAIRTLHLNAFLSAFEALIPEDSATAQAIRDKQSRTRIAVCARQEGYVAFAEELEYILSLPFTRQQAKAHAATSKFA